jgi:subfamily B ATP-binding cassette protein MsbA
MLSAGEQKNCYTNAAALIGNEEIVRVEKKKNLRILGFLKPHLRTFAMAILCMVLFGASDGALPFLIKEFLDGVFTSKDSNLLLILPALVTGLAVFRGLTGFGQEYLTAKVGHALVMDLRAKLHSQLLRLSPRFFSGSSTGDIISRFTSDVILIRDLLTLSLASICRDTVRIIALAAAAFYLDATLAFIAFIVFPLAFFPIYKFGRRIRKLSSRGQQEIGDVSSIVQETIAGNRVIKLFNREVFEENKFYRRNLDLFKTFVKSDRFKALTTPVNEILGALGISAVIIYGGNSVINGTRSQGDFIAFLVSVFLLYDPFKKLSKVYHQFMQGLSGAERIFEILDVEPDIREIAKPLSVPEDLTIQYENVSFQYAADKAPALKNINLTIRPGQKVALVGFSGSGKSTLVDLLPRFIDPSSGRVLIGGEDVRNLKLDEIRSKISVVSQHTFLFNDTIYNNIAYGLDGATVEQVEQAAKSAYIHEFILSLPLKYQTQVGEGGVSLSGGERQRIAIARAILKQSPILIMDEATASLDNKAEKEVQDALDRLESGRTSIIIAHRLSTVHNADHVVVMNEGEIAEAGTHNELLASTGSIFSKLHALQFRETP